jgi:hypothetical protein
MHLASIDLPVVVSELGVPVGLEVPVLLAVLSQLLEALKILLWQFDDLEVIFDALRVNTLRKHCRQGYQYHAHADETPRTDASPVDLVRDQDGSGLDIVLLGNVDNVGVGEKG